MIPFLLVLSVLLVSTGCATAFHPPAPRMLEKGCRHVAIAGYDRLPPRETVGRDFTGPFWTFDWAWIGWRFLPESRRLESYYKPSSAEPESVTIPFENQHTSVYHTKPHLPGSVSGNIMWNNVGNILAMEGEDLARERRLRHCMALEGHTVK